MRPSGLWPKKPIGYGTPQLEARTATTHIGSPPGCRCIGTSGQAQNIVLVDPRVIGILRRARVTGKAGPGIG